MDDATGADRRAGVRLFGTPGIAVGGDVTPLTPKVGAVLASLVLVGSDGGSVDQLADMVWPGPMPRTYETALRVHVMDLRRRLGDTDAAMIVRRSQGGYRLDPDRVDVDVHTFGRLVERSVVAHGDGRPSDAFVAARRALALWSDAPFRGLEDLLLAPAACAALHEQRVQAGEVLGASGNRLGRSDEVASLLSPVMASVPSDERLGVVVIRALQQAGRAGEAVRAAGALQHALRVDLGVTSQAVDALVGDLQRSTARSTRRTVPVPRSIVPRRSGPFVGRDEVIDRLITRLGSPDRTATVTVLSGPAGIGKSRLVEELCGDAHAIGVAACFARATDLASPYDVVRALVGPDGPTADGFDNGGVDGPGAVRSMAADRTRYHEAVAEWLLWAEPTLVVIDDVQQLDPDSAALLMAVVDRAADRRCHLVLTQRSGQPVAAGAQRLLAHATDAIGVEEVAVGPLSKSHTAQLADLLGLPAVDPVDLYERTGGNPLLVEEVVRLDTREVTHDAVLVDLVSRRFPAAGDVRVLLQAAAVLGSRCRQRDLLAVADIPSDDAVAALARCEEESLLEVASDGHVSFVHAAVREIVLGSLGSMNVQMLHRRAFEVLAATGGDGLATHARAAAHLLDPADAIRAVATAADDAYRRLAFEQSVALYEQAIALQSETRALLPGEAVTLSIQLARALAHTDERRCDDVRRKALPLATAAESSAAVIDLAEANVGRGLSETADLVGLLEAALRWAPAPDTSIRIRSRLAIERAESDRSASAFDMAEDALAEAESLGDPAALAASLRAVVSTGVHRLGAADYRRRITDLVNTARAMPDLDLEMIGLIHSVIDRLRHRETDEAILALRGFRILADDRRWPRYQAFASGISAVLSLSRGDRAAFERHAAQTTDLAGECGFDDAAVMVAGQQVCLAWHESNLAPLTETLELLAGDTNQPVVGAALACALAERGAYAAGRDAAVAIEHETLPRGLLYTACLALLSSYAATSGDEDMAAGLVAPVEALRGTDVVAGAGVGHFGPAEGFLAGLHATLGDHRAAAAAFDVALESTRVHQQVLAHRRLERDRAAANLAV